QTMAAITYLSLILMRIVFLANIFQTFTRATASWKRIREVLETENVQKSGNKDSDENRKGEIEFNHVTFAYPDSPGNPVLEDVSFSVKRGESIAVIGSTGCGKSSLVSLIPRFYDASSGDVVVDGQNVKDYNIRTLRDKIGIVQQKSELFSRSIKENITWGSEGVEDDAVTSAARIAQAEEFILRMPESYDTDVTEGGHSLSGGQKQRISIARAVVKKPEILILDDSGSALDLKTEAAFYDALRSEFTDTTKIIVAQRIASVRQADRIIVLDKGKICAEGTHEELIKTSDIYREICRSQMKKEAIA
ncbi:MAG: ABC transporter ATP-binding protein/permease, partial [Firmicutes bacterium]|nr:ABC transporter ATP-binding protein/permease [Bacillota bacterium]